MNLSKLQCPLPKILCEEKGAYFALTEPAESAINLKASSA